MKRTFGRVSRHAARVCCAGIAFFAAAHAAEAASPPEIRSSQSNQVPSCVTPDRLMAFVATRNTNLAPKLGTIALAYRDLGEAWHIRWDYAFYQMLLETNYLMYRRGDGSSGDVGLAQNNFAGIGATGGGVPGDRYTDMRTGVLAHMQHLVAYSGEYVERPVATRTREYQKDIIEISRKLGRPVKFSDLARRWATDRNYDRNIEVVAELFRKTHCSGAPIKEARAITALPPPSKLGAPAEAVSDAKPAEPAAKSSSLVRTIWRRGDPVPPAPRRAEPPRTTTRELAALESAGRLEPLPEALPSPALVRPPAAISAAEAQKQFETAGAARFAVAARAAVSATRAQPTAPAPASCRIFSASYGGARAVLIRSQAGGETRLTAVTVEEQSIQPMAAAYVANQAPGGEVLGTYDSKDAAIAAARQLCPQG